MARARIATALAASFVAATLLAPSGAAAADSSLTEIYAALRPQNLRTTTGSTTFVAGDTVELAYELVNTSGQPLVVPPYDFFGTTFHLVGTAQTWIERLGPFPTIPGIAPIIGRKGTWYASGGAIIAVDHLPSKTIPAGGSVPMGAATIYSTAGFPSGTYRFHVEYKPVLGGLFDVIATTSIDLTFIGTSSDQTPPLLRTPVDLVVEAASAAGAIVSYSASAVDDVDGGVPVTCAPESGTTFPLGTTNVQCIATDGAGNVASADFDVRVVDTTAPELTLPTGVVLGATSPDGAPPAYMHLIAATDEVDPEPVVSCMPTQGTVFPIGDTTVVCTATDVAGNSSQGSFPVHVKGAVEQLSDLVVLIDGYQLEKLGTSLYDKLAAAQLLLDDGELREAEEALAAFIAQVKAQAGKNLTQFQATTLVEAGVRIIAVIDA